MVQPEAAGDAPSGPVSRYGVASPAAVSGCAGTMISQFTFALRRRPWQSPMQWPTPWYMAWRQWSPPSSLR